MEVINQERTLNRRKDLSSKIKLKINMLKENKQILKVGEEIINEY
jgi:hypothetical protein